MTMKDKILHYFRDINSAYNDCTKYDTLKAALDKYEEETMFNNLEKIKKRCLESDDNCTDCPFNIKKNWDHCLFVGPYNYDIFIPQDWELDEVRKEGE